MPLKHHTETAYLVLLGLTMCLAGFVASLLPDLPEGLKYWVVAFTAFLLYPIFLMPTFRSNRADYEFRLLHWFPAATLVAWLFLQVTDSYWTWFHILKLGVFFLWSLPIVALGLIFTMMFSVSVIRRRVIRVTLLSIIFLLFTVGSFMAEYEGWNPRLQAALFQTSSTHFVGAFASRIRMISRSFAPSSAPSSSGKESSRSSSRSSVSSVAVATKTSSASSVSSSVIAEHTPTQLPKSGPESFFVLIATLLALYAGLLHERSSKRE